MVAQTDSFNAIDDPRGGTLRLAAVPPRAGLPI
jgi:hypothetical protein